MNKQRLRREVRRELILLRVENRELMHDEFSELAREHMREEFAGVSEVDWETILQLIAELLPIILALFKRE